MRRLLIGIGLLGLLGSGVPAQAALVDFTSSSWSGSTSQDYGALRLHLSTSVGSLATTAFDGIGGAPPCTPATLACEIDGIGIGPGDDEVTVGGSEVLTVSFTDLFDNPVAVNVNAIHFFDLFLSHPADPMPETAQWTFDVGGSGSLTGIAVGPGTGWHSTLVSVMGVHSIDFFATGPLSSSNTDFALAALDVEPIPEPTSLLLLGSGVLGLALRRRP